MSSFLACSVGNIVALVNIGYHGFIFYRARHIVRLSTLIPFVTDVSVIEDLVILNYAFFLHPL
jgi:hypothetical protein